MKILARHHALYETKITNCTHLMKLSVILIYFPEDNNRVFKNYLLWLWEIILSLRIGGDLFKKVAEKLYLSMFFKVEFFFLLLRVVFITRNKSLRGTMGRRRVPTNTARFKKRISSWRSCSRSVLRSLFLNKYLSIRGCRIRIINQNKFWAPCICKYVRLCSMYPLIEKSMYYRSYACQSFFTVSCLISIIVDFN